MICDARVGIHPRGHALDNWTTLMIERLANALQVPTWICRLLAVLVAILASENLPPDAVAEEIQPFFLSDQEPDEKVAPITMRLHPELVPLWRQALAHSESEMRRQAAEAIARAHRLGYTEIQSAIPDLLSVLAQEGIHPSARYAAAHALIVLDHRGSASTLFRLAQTEGKDFRQLVEPALARWDFAAIRPVWRERIAAARPARRDLILAIDGLGQQRDADALEILTSLAMKAEHPADVRLAAARAAGQIADQGLDQHAEHLLARGRESVLNRLCAVSLIARHRSEATIGMRQKLGTDTEPAVAADALRSLFEIDPKLVLPLFEVSLSHPDSNLRRIGIQTGIALPTVDRVKLLALRLNDPHPQLRGMVRDGFHALSRDAAIDSTIRQSTIAILDGDDWRGQEQAALLLGALDEERVASRLIELLDSPRPEVTVAVAWSLKTLAVPETAGPVLAFAEARTKAPQPITRETDDRLAHLFELLGRLKVVAALPLLEMYVPKSATFGVNSRAAAVWGLGVIQEGHANERLSTQLLERVNDTMSSPPEELKVRRASILSLGRLRAKTQLPGLKQLIGEQVDNDWLELSARWAIQQISGETLPIGPPLVLEQTGWFLEPIPPTHKK
jgi:HEAT repeat protein